MNLNFGFKTTLKKTHWTFITPIEKKWSILVLVEILLYCSMETRYKKENKQSCRGCIINVEHSPPLVPGQILLASCFLFQFCVDSVNCRVTNWPSHVHTEPCSSPTSGLSYADCCTTRSVALSVRALARSVGDLTLCGVNLWPMGDRSQGKKSSLFSPY